MKLFNVIQQTQAASAAAAEEVKALRGSGKPTLPAPVLDKKKSKKGKQKDNVIGRAKEGPFAYRALVMIPMADARDSDLGAGRLP